MNINARVMAPLKVEVIEHIDLGAVTAGDKNVVGTGKYKITAQDTGSVVIKFKEFAADATSGTVNIMNSNGNGQSIPVELQSNLSSTTVQGNKETDVIMSATANVPTDVSVGSYNGTLTLAVKYN